VWGDWGDCSQTCGNGTSTRTREVCGEQGDADLCPRTFETRSCEIEACPLPTASPTAAPIVIARPVINVFEGDVIILEATTADEFTDTGASCVDSTDGDLSPKVIVQGVMFPRRQRPGTYKLNYDCVNSRGASGVTASKQVVVRDTTCPTCTVNTGADTFEASFPYMDAGAVCEDSLSGAVAEVVVTNPVDVEKTGEYIVTYRARDSVGNWNDGSCKGSHIYKRTVQVVDTLKPIIALKYAATHFTDPAYTPSYLAHAGHGNEMSSVTGQQNPAGASFRAALQDQAAAEYGSTNFHPVRRLLGEKSMSIVGGSWTVAILGSLIAAFAMLAMRTKSEAAPAFEDV